MQTVFADKDPAEVVGFFRASRTYNVPLDVAKVRKALQEINSTIKLYTWNYLVPEFKYERGEINCWYDGGHSLEDLCAITHLVFRLSELLPSFYFDISPLSSTEFFDFLFDHEFGFLFINNGRLYVLKKFTDTIDEAVEKDSAKIREDCEKWFKNQEFHRAKITMPEKMFAYFQANPLMVGPAASSAPVANITDTDIDKMVNGKYGRTLNSIIKLTRPQYVSLLGKTRNPDRVGTALCLGLQKCIRRNNLTDYDCFTFESFVCKETTADPDGEWIKMYEKRREDYLSRLTRLAFDQEIVDDNEIISIIRKRCEQGDEEMISIVNQHVWQNDTVTPSEEEEILSRMQRHAEEDSDWEYVQEAYEEYGQSDYSDDYSDDYDSEQEVMEAIMSDPDLFMKVMAMQSERGESVSAMRDFINTFGKVKQNPPSGPQKGIRDIPAERFDDSSLESEEGEDAVYSETMAQIKARLGNARIEDSE